MGGLGEFEGIRYEVFSMEDAVGFTAVVTEAFTGYEPMSLAMGIPFDVFYGFMGGLAVKAAEEGLSVIARDIASGKVVGALVNEDLMSPPAETPNPLDSRFNPIFTLLGELTEYYRDSHDFQLGECLHVFMIGVTHDYKGRSLSSHLISHSLKNARNKGFRAVCTEATGRISQHIFGKKFGFHELKKTEYKTFVYNGEQIFRNIKDHWGAYLMERGLAEPSEN